MLHTAPDYCLNQHKIVVHWRPLAIKASCFFIIVLAVLSYITGLAYVGYASLIFVGGIFVVSHCRWRIGARKVDLLFLLLLLFCEALILINVVRFTSGALYIGAVFLLSFYAAISVSKSDVDLFSAARVALFFYFAFFVYKCLTVGYSQYAVNDFLIGSSRNMVSAIALVLQIFYCFTYYRRHKKMPIITPILTLIVCFVCYGRSGIIISALLVALCIFCNIKNTKSYLATLLVVALFAASVVGVINHLDTLTSETNFSREGLDSPRTRMNAEYIDGINFIDFFAGRAYTSSATIVQYDLNPHNSFLRGHHFMGLPYLLLLVALFFWGVILTLRRGVIWESGLCALFAVRCLFDVTSLPGSFDFLFFYMYFSMLNRQV